MNSDKYKQVHLTIYFSPYYTWHINLYAEVLKQHLTENNAFSKFYTLFFQIIENITAILIPNIYFTYD